jgi:transcriptional regulator with XRE-family HTH domain
MAEAGGFPSRLRMWRSRRGKSQLALALDADVSQRHLSFLELGRAAPSRDMVLRLSAAMALPMRSQNELLLSAGFAPMWRETPMDTAGLGAVNRALEFMLRQQEPYPAFVVDRRWTLLRANAGARGLVAFLLDAPGWQPDPANPVNLADALVGPAVLRPFIANWHDVVLYFVRSVQADALFDGTDETRALLDRLLAYPDVPRLADLPAPEEVHEPVLAIAFEKGETPLRLFTALTTLGTPQNITTQEIRVETFFPADPASDAIMKAWSADPT